MPKAKPLGLHSRHNTKAEREAKREAELSLSPVSDLPDIPPQLHDQPYALAAYQKLMSLYSETIAEMVTAFDLDLLVDYCLSLQEFHELRAVRAGIMKLWSDIDKRIHARGKKDARALAGDASYLLGELRKIDARLDIKSNRCERLRRSLYLTPPSRAGKAPAKKPEPVTPEEMEKILEDV